MADNQLSVKYNLRQLNNANNNAHLLWFPRVVRTDTLSLRGLSDHIFSHGSPYTRDTVIGVLTAFRDCMVELLSAPVAELRAATPLPSRGGEWLRAESH